MEITVLTVQTEPPSEILQDENCETVMDYNPDNKRSSYRIKINSPVTLKTKSFAEIPSQAQNVQTINLSEGGLCISLNSRIELPSPLLCEFTLLNSPLQFQGKIVWEKIFDDGKYYCGVQFINKDEKQDSILKSFLYTKGEYIDQLIESRPETKKETFKKISILESPQLNIPTSTLLINGEDLDTGKYEYFPYADKLIAEPKATLRIIRQLKNGEIPANYKDYIFARYCVGLEDTNAKAIKAAYEAFQSFKHFPLNKRKKVLYDIYRLLSKNRSKLLDLMVIEGHPVKVAEWEINGMLKGLEKKTIDFYISQLNKKIKIDKEVIYLKRRPDGVICVSPPKNAPSSNSGIAILALLCGNTLIIKPPYRGPISTIFLWKEVVYKALIENDAPPGTINIVLGNSETITDEWVMSKYVNDVIYIGDSKRGLEIGAMAYHYGKKPILELSGSDILFVWKDAQIDKVVNSLLDGFLGSMQICMVPKKCVVHEDIFEEFKSKFIEEVKKLKVGLPSNPMTILSPVANIPLFYNFLEDALQKGAKLVCGGKRFNYDGHSNDNGVFISPTIIEIGNIEDAIQMKCFSEENFFPLLPLIKATAKSTHKVLDIGSAKKNSKDEIIFNKMISISNLNQYGLRCSVWVTSKKYKNRFIENIHNCGMLRVNSRHIDFSTYLSTHGGTGKTGGPFGEMNYIWQKTSHLQGVSVF